jgi:hypothetical protein
LSTSSSHVEGLLPRNATLLNLNASPTRRSEDLKKLLGSGSSAKVKSGSVIVASTPLNSSTTGNVRSKSKKEPDTVSYEQGRSKVRVSLDLNLETDVVVEGGYLAGVLTVRVKPKKSEDVFRLGCGKVRVAGFEVYAAGSGPSSAGGGKGEERHMFYQFAEPLEDVSVGCKGLYVGDEVDKDGFGSVGEGEYDVPFSMKLPAAGNADPSMGRPRGTLHARAGAGVQIRYILIAYVHFRFYYIIRCIS